MLSAKWLSDTVNASWCTTNVTGCVGVWHSDTIGEVNRQLRKAVSSSENQIEPEGVPKSTLRNPAADLGQVQDDVLHQIEK